MRRFTTATLLVVGVTVMAACLPIAKTPSGHKPLITGLVGKGSETPYHQGIPYPVVDLTDVADQAPAFGGIVINQTWAQLEPSQGVFNFTTLDASLAVVGSYNARHQNAPLSVRLRVFAAYVAPTWAKTIAGPPINVSANLPSNTGGILGEWWKSRYRSAWAALQLALAGRYNDNPLLREVAVSSCSSLTAEPFVMAPRTIQAATPYGWTIAAQEACLRGAFSDYAPWTHTALYFPMNPLAGNQSFTDKVMRKCIDSATAGGPWCILANNALSPDAATTSRSAPVYSEMDSLWSARPADTSIAFQMNGPDSATYCQAIAVAVDHHARSVELWPATGSLPGFTSVPTPTLIAWSKALRRGKATTCTS